MATLQCEYFSQARHGYASFTAILPIEPPADAPFPTVYLLHGFGGSRSQWTRGAEVEKLAALHGVAVIMPDGGNRFYLDNEETDERYGAMVGEELVDVTRRMFRLSRRREDTAIAGLSMGGYGAIRNGLRYADTFGAIMAFSSALITDEVARMAPEGGGNGLGTYGYYRATFGDPEKLAGGDKDPAWLAAERVRAGNPPRMFLACGREDSLYGVNEAYHRRLEALGYEHAWWVRQGAHDFAFWSPTLAGALEWWIKG